MGLLNPTLRAGEKRLAERNNGARIDKQVAVQQRIAIAKAAIRSREADDRHVSGIRDRYFVRGGIGAVTVVGS